MVDAIRISAPILRLAASTPASARNLPPDRPPWRMSHGGMLCWERSRPVLWSGARDIRSLAMSSGFTVALLGKRPGHLDSPLCCRDADAALPFLRQTAVAWFGGRVGRVRVSDRCAEQVIVRASELQRWRECSTTIDEAALLLDPQEHARRVLLRAGTGAVVFARTSPKSQHAAALVCLCAFSLRVVPKALGFWWHPEDCPEICEACDRGVLPRTWWAPPGTAMQLAEAIQREPRLAAGRLCCALMRWPGGSKSIKVAKANCAYRDQSA